jgi:hypothetical protein
MRTITNPANKSDLVSAAIRTELQTLETEVANTSTGHDHNGVDSNGVLVPTTVNGLTLASMATGFTIAGGTASKVLTLDTDFTASAVPTLTGVQNLTNKTMQTGCLWNGTKIGVLYGGTNLSTIAAGSVLAANTVDTLTAITSVSGTSVLTNTNGTITWGTGGGVVMVYPSAGIGNSTGSAWGTSYTTSGSGTVLALATSPVFVTPTLGAALATTVNGLTLASAATGFTIAGGTASRTLTLDANLTASTVLSSTTGFTAATTGSSTHNAATTGSQVIAHGLGKTPKLVKIKAIGVIAGASYMSSSDGSFDGSTMTSTCYYGVGGINTYNSSSIIDLYGLGNGSYATISVNSTNITLNWFAAAAPTGTIYFTWIVEG